MKTLLGIGVSDRVAVEKILYLEKVDYKVEKETNKDISTEKGRFEDAKKQAIIDLSHLIEKTASIDKESSKVFEIHQMMIEDLDFVEGVEAEIEKHYSAEYAISQTRDKFTKLFQSMDDEMMRERAADVVDVSNRLIGILKGIQSEDDLPEGKFIIVSEDIYPSQIVKFDYNQIAGFVTKYGSNTSHASILARTLDIPTVVNLKERFDEIPHFGLLAINGATGEVVINPNKFIKEVYAKKKQVEIEKDNDLKKYIGKKAKTKNGHKIVVGANIGNVSDTDLAINNDADAIGLFRSEFIYLESNDYPSEEKQYNIYKNVLSKMDGKQVIIRTMDIGADKQVGYFNLKKEENPALGYRAIRICLKNKALFKTQLRALYRSSVHGNLAIMIPMITHIEQVLETKELINEVKKELKEEGFEYSEQVSLGIMIETPASVMISDLLAQEVDFFSIGTNDLTQYTLAADRMNSEILDLYDSKHESIKRMISMVSENAHKAGIWVGICGESAADVDLLDFYIDIKIDELSVSPSKVLRLKKEILNR
jgi:phosphotransferase system enzyme I (PtsI)